MSGSRAAHQQKAECNGHHHGERPLRAELLHNSQTHKVLLERTVRELRGEPCLRLEEFAPTKQQIVCSRSFESRITEYQDMRQAVCAYAERAAEKLRSERQYCRQIAVFFRTSPHAVGETF